MRILYFHQYFSTPKGSGGVRSFEFSKRWVAQGNKVDVVMGGGMDPSLSGTGVVEVEGIRIHKLGIPYSPNMGKIRRILVYLRFALKSIWFARKAGNYDVILASSTPLTIAVPALCAKWISSRPLVFEVRDVWPDAAIDIGAIRNRTLIWAAKFLENRVYHASERIVPLSSGMQERIERKGVDSKKMVMIPNCSDTERFPSIIDYRKKRRASKGDDKFIILYVGAISQANDIEYLIDIFHSMPNNGSWEWWFVGDGNRFDLLKELGERSGLEGIKVFGRRARDEVTEFIRRADLGIVSFVHTPVYFENSPNKFFDYIAGALPVLFTRTTWLAPYLAEFDCGVICSKRDPRFVADEITKLVENPGRALEMGIRARRLAEEKFSRENMAAKYLEVFSEAINLDKTNRVQGLKTG